MRREKLWAKGTSELKSIYKHLFSTLDNDQLAFNKTAVFREEVFDHQSSSQTSIQVVYVAETSAPSIKGILLESYMAHHFSDKKAYDDFMTALLSKQRIRSSIRTSPGLSRGRKGTIERSLVAPPIGQTGSFPRRR